MSVKDLKDVKSKSDGKEGGGRTSDDDDDGLVLSIDADGQSSYNRNSSPESVALSRALAQLYGVSFCLIVPSGMAAIHTAVADTLLALRGNAVNLVYASELFSPTVETIKFVASVYNLRTQLHCVDVKQPQALCQLFDGKLKGCNNILFVESCSNPNGYMLDLTVVPRLRKASKTFKLVVDNTWLSVAAFNPFAPLNVPLHSTLNGNGDGNGVGKTVSARVEQEIESDYRAAATYKCDVAVVSLTKHYSGGRAIAGAVLTDNPKLADGFARLSRMLGHHVSPIHAKMIIASLSTLDQRVKRSGRVAVEVVRQLEALNVRVCHPSLPSHPSHAIAKRFLLSYPSVFTFMLTGKKKEIKELLASKAKARVLEFKTSFGSSRSRIDTYPKMRGKDVECRIAVGYGSHVSADELVQAVNDIALASSSLSKN